MINQKRVMKRDAFAWREVCAIYDVLKALSASRDECFLNEL